MRPVAGVDREHRPATVSGNQPMSVGCRDRRPVVDAIEPRHDAAWGAPDPDEVLVACGRAGLGILRHVMVARNGDDAIGRDAEMIRNQFEDELVAAGCGFALGVARKNTPSSVRLSLVSLSAKRRNRRSSGPSRVPAAVPGMSTLRSSRSKGTPDADT